MGSRPTAEARPGCRSPPGITATTELAEAVAPCSLLLVAVPSRAFRQLCRDLASVLRPEQLVIHGTKGLGDNAKAFLVMRGMAELMRLASPWAPSPSPWPVWTESAI